MEKGSLKIYDMHNKTSNQQTFFSMVSIIIRHIATSKTSLNRLQGTAGRILTLFAYDFSYYSSHKKVRNQRLGAFPPGSHCQEAKPGGNDEHQRETLVQIHAQGNDDQIIPLPKVPFVPIRQEEDG